MERKQLLTTKQVADRMNVSQQTIFKWSRKGILPGVKLGYLLRFEPDAVEEFIASGRN
jgi:excisionase family DNA binding protein